jgi:hypothetical protein
VCVFLFPCFFFFFFFCWGTKGRYQFAHAKSGSLKSNPPLAMQEHGLAHVVHAAMGQPTQMAQMQTELALLRQENARLQSENARLLGENLALAARAVDRESEAQAGNDATTVSASSPDDVAENAEPGVTAAPVGPSQATAQGASDQNDH